MNISDSNLCLICCNEIETMKHAFIDCNSVIILWNQLERWVKTILRRTVKFTNIDKILGRKTTTILLYKIITCAKTVIYKNRTIYLDKCVQKSIKPLKIQRRDSSKIFGNQFMKIYTIHLEYNNRTTSDVLNDHEDNQLYLQYYPLRNDNLLTLIYLCHLYIV